MTRWGLLALALLLIASPSWADGVVVAADKCSATWLAPQTNADGSNLADLKEYGVYVASSAAAVAALATPTYVVASPELDPATGRTVKWDCSNKLAIGQYYAQIDAVDTSGNRGGRTVVVPFVVRDAVSPQVPGLPVFGQ